ncbi:FKBP-type peptidyl-prolyl cis-trans isomerase [Pedobacter endophyticus]|uniref:peptidylprolyl isomerase n=1 Tax=Pedobacter endophyticus TaxID=2789740 RepID=A0A7U3SQB9_9SPHI|nr:FKBP-type peptidyl-prolyl cis-trans isomerase [Pedobacter endophyticus]QPH38779.1 FKBP-type peptidyl-prolyl cis-trans isomerase [Pedobacter endophyticus]
MKGKSIFFVFAVALGLSACNKFEKGEGGMMYKIYSSEGKPKIQEGDYVKLNGIETVETTTNPDSVMVNTYDNERPAFFAITKSMFPGDLTSGLKLLGEGDSAVFKLNLDSMEKYSGQPNPKNLKSRIATFTIKIEKVLHKGNDPDSIFDAKKRLFFEAEYKGLIEKNKIVEPAKIKKYIEENDLKVNTAPSGLRYIIERPGNSERATLLDTVVMNYTGQFLNKKSNGQLNVFDTSDAKVARDAGIFSESVQYVPRNLPLGQLPQGVIQGIQMIGVGGKIKMILPSKLAFGENGGGPFNPFTPLVFDVELKKIIKPNTATPAE